MSTDSLHCRHFKALEGECLINSLRFKVTSSLHLNCYIKITLNNNELTKFHLRYVATYLLLVDLCSIPILSIKTFPAYLPCDLGSLLLCEYVYDARESTIVLTEPIKLLICIASNYRMQHCDSGLLSFPFSIPFSQLPFQLCFLSFFFLLFFFFFQHARSPFKSYWGVSEKKNRFSKESRLAHF